MIRDTILYFIRFIIIFVIIHEGRCLDENQTKVDDDCHSVPVLGPNPNNLFLPPTVMIVILARNKAHILPHFLGSLEALDYPKSRISLWVRSDHNVDQTDEVLDLWVSQERDQYNSVNYEILDSPEKFIDETSIYDWTPLRYEHIIQLREEALQTAKDIWADFVWFLDCDSILTNTQVLHRLIEQEKTVITPMLQSSGAYSNFWCGMNDRMYYKRTPDYLSIVERDKTGCFEVPMVHSATLIDLRKQASSKLTFDPKNIALYEGPMDDIIAFATSARINKVPLFMLNSDHFGYMMSPLGKNDTTTDELEQLTNMRLEAMVEGPPLAVSPYLSNYISKNLADKLGFDQIYLINLERREARKERMLKSLQEMGVTAQLVKAVDGKTLNDSYLTDMGIKILPGYRDPYNKRSMKMGEIGCFLSHYAVWQDMLANQHRTILVLEDDIRFEPYFRRKLQAMLTEIQKVDLHWELIYLGRKRLSKANEPVVAGTSRVVQVDYSYWTLAYLLTLDGARKLVTAEPLSKIVPVDEYLPIMFDRHPQETWRMSFNPRDLRAFSSLPLLIYPTHYTGESNYISDTEDSDVVSTPEPPLPSESPLRAPHQKDEL